MLHIGGLSDQKFDDRESVILIIGSLRGCIVPKNSGFSSAEHHMD